MPSGRPMSPGAFWLRSKSPRPETHCLGSEFWVSDERGTNMAFLLRPETPCASDTSLTQQQPDRTQEHRGDRERQKRPSSAITISIRSRAAQRSAGKTGIAASSPAQRLANTNLLNSGLCRRNGSKAELPVHREQHGSVELLRSSMSASATGAIPR
jgi:hypothetical protein